MGARTPLCSPETIVVMTDLPSDVTIGVESLGGNGDVVEEQSKEYFCNSFASGGVILDAAGRFNLSYAQYQGLSGFIYLNADYSFICFHIYH